MKVPANVSADKLILDYLARVTEAGTRYLPKGARLAFVAKTKARIERECGEAGIADVERVWEVLSGLGEPEELVRTERARIDAEWVKRRARGRPASAATSAAEITEPLQHRPITSRWKPATDAHLPIPTPPWTGHDPQSGRDTGPQHAPPEQPAPGHGAPTQPLSAQSVPAPSAPAGAVPWQPITTPGVPRKAPSPEPAPQGEPAASLPAGSYPDRPLSYPAPPRGSAVPHRVPETPPEGLAPSQDGAAAGSGPQDAVPDQRRALPRPSRPDLAAVFAASAKVARRQPVEALAIVLLGLGAILPFPFWLLGGVTAVISRFYDARDKWLATGGPLLLALLGTVVTAVLVGGHDNPVGIYFHALRLDVGLLVRAGCLLCGWYLIRRLRRGPRLRIPPWQR